MTKLDQLIGGYLSKEIQDDTTSTITFLHHAEKLSDPFTPATEEYAHHVVLIWRPSWLKGIDWCDDSADADLIPQ